MKTRETKLAVWSSLVLLPVLTLTAASPPNASLMVQVAPAAFLELQSPPQWNASGDVQTLAIPLRVMVRLNRGTSGLLSIARVAQAAASKSRLRVETAGGTKEITASGVVIRSYPRSGIFRDPVVISQLNEAAGDSQPITLELSLSTTDGAAEWSQTIIVPPAVAPASPRPLRPTP